jgi:hypothetical protein
VSKPPAMIFTEFFLGYKASNVGIVTYFRVDFLSDNLPAEELHKGAHRICGYQCPTFQRNLLCPCFHLEENINFSPL